MKKLYNVFLIVALPAAFLFLTSEIMYPTGSPGGKTGSPGDNGANCTQCHTGSTPINEELWIFSPDLFTMGYNPSQTYSFLVTGIDEDANKFGFEATAEDNDGNKVGTFQSNGLGFTQTINDSQAITHTALGNNPLSDSGTVWMFTWTAPAVTAGPITFYAAINAANGNGNTGGDQIHLSQFTSSPATGLADISTNSGPGAYPNPSSGMISFKKGQLKEGQRIDIVNLGGQAAHTFIASGNNQSIDLSDLKKGVYIVRAGEKSQRLILN